MKSLILALAAITLMSCTKTETPAPDNSDSKIATIHRDSLNLSTISFAKTQTIIYDYPAHGNPIFTLNPKGAIEGATATLVTNCASMTGFECRAWNMNFTKFSPNSDYTIDRTNTSLTIVIIYKGLVSGVPSFEWYDIKH